MTQIMIVILTAFLAHQISARIVYEIVQKTIPEPPLDSGTKFLGFDFGQAPFKQLLKLLKLLQTCRKSQAAHNDSERKSLFSC